MKIKEIIHATLLITLMLAACTRDEGSEAELEQQNLNTAAIRGIDNFLLSFSYCERFATLAEMASEQQQEPLLIYLLARESGESYYLASQIENDGQTFHISSSDELLSELPHESYILCYAGIDKNSDDELSAAERESVGLIFEIVNSTELSLSTTVTTRSTTLGAGSENDPYVIATEDDFLTLITAPLDAGDDLSGVYFQQSGLITCSKAWGCAGSSGQTYFNGNFNGGCKYYNKESEFGLHNLFISQDSNAAIFYGIGESGVVKDLGLVNANIFCSSYASGVATRMNGGTISGVKFFSGVVLGTKYVSGLVSSGYGTFENCYICCNLSSIAEGDHFGGYLGYCTGESSFENCIYRGSIEAISGSYVGGFIGSTNCYNEEITMEKCYVCGDITGGSFIGGFVGRVMSDINMNECIAGATKNTLQATDDEKVQALIDSDLFNSTTMDQDITVASLYTNETTNSTCVYSDYDYNLNISLGGFFGAIHGTDENTTCNCTVTACSVNYYEALDSNQPTVLALPNNDQIEDTGDRSYNYIGGFCGYAEYVTFANCDFTNNGTVGDSSNYVNFTGGVIGCLYDCEVNSCTFNNYGRVSGSTANAASYYMGGILGYFKPNTTNSNNCANCTFHNRGEISGRDYIGGVIGYCPSSGGLTSKLRLENYASVSGANYVGGITGCDYGLITSCGDMQVGNSEASLAINCSSNYGGGLIGFAHIGASKTLSNSSYITVTGANYLGGLYGWVYIDTSDISLTIDADQHIIIEGTSYIGGMIGSLNSKSTTITTNRDLSGNVKSTGLNVGGVVGLISDCSTDFTQCHNMIEVSTTGNDAELKEYGGIVGRAEGDCTLQLTQCSNRATITGGGASVGGLVGIVDCDDGHKATFQECYNSGQVICNAGDDSANVGGILGKARSSLHVTDCYNSGAVTDVGDGVAGLVGYVLHVGKEDGYYRIEYSYNAGTAGWGTAGGSTSLHNHELRGYEAFYYDAASHGDLDKNKYESTGLSKDEMNSDESLYLGTTRPTEWGDEGDTSLPYLKNVTPDDDRPAI